MGNRGLLHNERQEIVRPFRLTAWITCVLSFKGRRRKVMSPGQYTELFFFDEATAFSAGHRPCFECRRADALRFKTAWIKGNPGYGFDEKTPIGAIDEVLHRERVSLQERFDARVATLPNGSFIEWEGDAWVVYAGAVYRWSVSGYGERTPGPEGAVRVLTPRSVVNAFRAGYVAEVLVKREV
jgi:hypothetical protein